MVNTAIDFGEDDFLAAAEEQGQTSGTPVRLDGNYDNDRPVRGGAVRQRRLNRDLVEDLRARGALASRGVRARLSQLLRCGTPLLYYAKPAWYIRTSQMRDRRWRPRDRQLAPRAHQARALRQWLRTTSMGPLAGALMGYPDDGVALRGRAQSMHRVYEELRQQPGVEIGTAKSYVVLDDVPSCPGLREEMRRVPRGIDVCVESGSMPSPQ